MCKYCNSIVKTGYEDVDLDSTDNTSLRMFQAANKVYLIAESFEDSAQIEIEYCPFCGRNLNN